MSDRHAKKRATMVANLPEKTGRTLEQWVALVRAEGPGRSADRVAWLKQHHGLGHFQARLVATEAAD